MTSSPASIAVGNRTKGDYDTTKDMATEYLINSCFEAHDLWTNKNNRGLPG